MVETARLPEAERAALEELVRTSRFFALPARAPRGGAGPGARPRPAPDARQLDIEIEDEGRSHRVTVSEHATSPALRDLVDRVWDAAEPG